MSNSEDVDLVRVACYEDDAKKRRGEGVVQSPSWGNEDLLSFLFSILDNLLTEHAAEPVCAVCAHPSVLCIS